MGEHQVPEEADDEALQTSMRSVLADLLALEEMLDTDLIESGVRRIGAEQEMFLVTASGRPAPIATELLAAIDHPAFTTEIARFNLEANLNPHDLGGSCLRRIEEELEEYVGLARDAARAQGANIVLCGILPTLRLADLSLANMTPMPRYFALNRAMTRLRGGDFHLVLKGVDELEVHHGNVMLEACNTSFQIHFQTSASDFPRLYNLAQAITAPVLAAAVNSPALLGKRLWNETRVAVFQHSVDTRSKTHKARGGRPRVHFGDSWVDKSVLEIFREDIARFRLVLAPGVEENSLELVRKGIAPRLRALCTHNGTVYRWNRACYGVKDGVGHLRIENRVLPAGPTIIDEVANAAFYFGLLCGLGETCDDVRARMAFDDAKGNFLAAARHGLEAQLTWLDGERLPAAKLIVDRLLPLARRGLERSRIDPADIDRYLGVVQARVESGQTGARWALSTLAELGEDGTRDERFRTLCAATLTRQLEGTPVHDWPPVGDGDRADWRESFRTVGQYMQTELFTVRPGDLVDFAASVMDWEHLRHVPVEDDSGRLIGLVSHRALLRLVGRGGQEASTGSVRVESIMRRDPVTVSPETSTLDAIQRMREAKVGCLPVVDAGKLVGIVTERDFIDAAAKVFEEHLKGGGST